MTMFDQGRVQVGKLLLYCYRLVGVATLPFSPFFFFVLNTYISVACPSKELYTFLRHQPNSELSRWNLADNNDFTKHKNPTRYTNYQLAKIVLNTKNQLLILYSTTTSTYADSVSFFFREILRYYLLIELKVVER